jgi:hypothetical protein
MLLLLVLLLIIIIIISNIIIVGYRGLPSPRASIGVVYACKSIEIYSLLFIYTQHHYNNNNRRRGSRIEGALQNKVYVRSNRMRVYDDELKIRL